LEHEVERHHLQLAHADPRAAFHASTLTVEQKAIADQGVAASAAPPGRKHDMTPEKALDQSLGRNGLPGP